MATFTNDDGPNTPAANHRIGWRRSALGRLTAVGLLACCLSTSAFAQDDLDPFLGDDDEIDIDLGDPPADDPPADTEGEEPEPAKPPVDLGDPMDDDIDFQDALDGDEPGEDLLGEEPDAVATPGSDTAAIYRMTIDAGDKLDVDEELQLWDAYLDKYPNTAFRQQIDLRRKELEEELYNVNRTNPDDDAKDAEDEAFAFSHGVILENINPRNRALILVEWGLPDYASLAVDIEKELSPGFSIHGGIRRRFTGLSVEGGARYALMRSPRTKTLVTAMLDIRANTAPAFFAVRPMIGFGKRFAKVDLQAQLGVELAPRKGVDARIIGGVNATYRASDAVGLFAETALYMHTVSGGAGPYRFNQFVFGMKFLPAQKIENPENVEVSLAATLPYSSAYWQFHYGSVVGQVVLGF